jgi:hypothetical protein
MRGERTIGKKVGVAALSAATVAGPLLFTMPDHVLFGGHTMGLGTVLAIISGFTIFVSVTSRLKIW